MAVRVHLMPTEHPGQSWSSDVITVEDAGYYETQATSGAGLIVDVYDQEGTARTLRATFGHVLYAETVTNTDETSVLTKELTARLRAVVDKQGKPLWVPGLPVHGPDYLLGCPIRIR